MKTKTREMYPVSEAQSKHMELLDGVLLRGTPNAKEAVKTMVSYANTTQDAIANEMGKEQYSISRFINGNRGMNIDEIENFINACGNLYLIQYFANKYNFKLVAIDSKEARINELEYLLAQEKRAA